MASGSVVGTNLMRAEPSRDRRRSSGPWIGTDASQPEAGRYHLYVSYACPWAHRTLIARAVRGLDDAIGDHRRRSEDERRRLVFRGGRRRDPLGGAKFLRDVYVRAAPRYTGRVTVPVLWDKKKDTIVNNESRDIMRMFDTAIRPARENPTSLAPPELRAQIDAALDDIYEPFNNGVYRAGFATKQYAYEEACRDVFADARSLRSDPVAPTLSLRRRLHRSGRRVLYDVDSLRPRLLRPLQVQRSATRRTTRTSGASYATSTRCPP